ncbi:serine/threonine receptor-like kinase NFP [Primulina huaijiensis]|uniref:serine/threonine receptor-like kinase NFP n=1 Tax=Primulina huaijiensis TaxID=1492673 RepID=UPI003CC6DEB9
MNLTKIMATFIKQNMAASFDSLLLIFSLSLVFSVCRVAAQLPNNTARTDFTCSAGSMDFCETYLTYRVRAPYSDLGSISDLFGISRMKIATATNLTSEDAELFPEQLLLIPVKCSCNGKHYFSNVTYRIKKDDSFYSVSIKPFENLTNYLVVQDMNPLLHPTKLTIGEEAVFPLLCKCPGKFYSEKGIQYLVTYVWQPGDQIVPVSAMFQASPSDIVVENNNRNFTDAICLPVLIPVKTTILVQPYPSPATHGKSQHHRILVAIACSVTALLIVLFGLSAYVHFYKNRNSSSLETSDLIRTKKASKEDCFEPKTVQDKILPGVSGDLGKPVMYDVQDIMKATVNLSERYRIRGSVYKGMIDDQVFAIKKTRDASEELQILQRVNHANLVRLMGVSSDNGGNVFMLCEYAENGSLDEWLFPKESSSLRSSVECLTWNQRLFIALDVAYGIQYMHEHAQPSTVHKDIRASNILLDSNFKAKISNFSTARTATSSIMLKIDIFSFGVVVLEILSGRKVMEKKDNREAVMLWKEIKGILEIEEQRKEKLSEWMDPNLKGSYPIDDALNLATLARACTSENSSDRPKMAEIVFSLCVLTQSSPQMYDRYLISRFEADEVFPAVNQVIAR